MDDEATEALRDILDACDDQWRGKLSAEDALTWIEQRAREAFRKAHRQRDDDE